MRSWPSIISMGIRCRGSGKRTPDTIPFRIVICSSGVAPSIIIMRGRTSGRKRNSERSEGSRTRNSRNKSRTPASAIRLSIIAGWMWKYTRFSQEGNNGHHLAFNNCCLSLFLEDVLQLFNFLRGQLPPRSQEASDQRFNRSREHILNDASQ